MVSATALGVTRHDAIAQRRRDALSIMLAAFDTDERRHLADLLDRLVGSLDEFASSLADD
jgi:hypothetical protein